MYEDYGADINDSLALDFMGGYRIHPRVALEGEGYGEAARLVLRVERRREAVLREALAGLGVDVAEVPADGIGGGSAPAGGVA